MTTTTQTLGGGWVLNVRKNGSTYWAEIVFSTDDIALYNADGVLFGCKNKDRDVAIERAQEAFLKFAVVTAEAASPDYQL